MHSSALSELRSKQSSPPLLHLDTLGLTSWDTSILDSDDLAALWNAFTKCKKVLSDGYRLENITWRLWQREQILVSGVKLHPPSNHSSSSSSSSSLQSSHSILSDSFTIPISPPISTFSNLNSSFQTPSSNSNLNHLSPSSTPITPRPSSHPHQSTSHPNQSTSPSHQSTSHPNQSSEQSPQSPRDVSHILPPPRPNSITPTSFGAIIDTLLPMDLVAEQAHAKELLASSTRLNSTATSTTNTNATVLTPHLILLDNEHPPDPGTHQQEQQRLTYLNPSSYSSNHSSSASSSSDTPIRLKAPPRIVNIAPTPPSASPAVTAPTSPIMGPASSSSPTQLPFSHIQSLLTVSPSLTLPCHLTSSPADEVDKRNLQPVDPTTLCTRQSSKNTLTGLQPRRPLCVKQYSSSSTTTSSMGFKSIGTSPSVDERECTSSTSKAASKKPSIRGPTGVKHRLNPRRTNSTSGIKLGSTRRPISYLRSVSGGGTTTRSVSPNLGTSKQKSEEWNQEDDKVNQHQSILTSESPSLIGTSQLSKLTDESSPLILSTARPSPIPSTSLLPNLLDESTSGNHSNPTSCSSSSLMSPVIPVTPNNSKASNTPVFTMTSPNNSPSIFLPSAPPPTPAENGVPLPTTMSAGIEKSNAIAAAGIPTSQLQVANGKKKAKFYINGYETEDDGVLSPPSVPNPAPISAPNPISQGTIASTSSNNPTDPIIGRLRPVQERVISEAEESEDDDDEDEWDSSYSDSSDEGEAEAELARKKAQEAYHRQLFAKKSFTVDPSSAPIKRAGLSMLFHPETNASGHHPTKSSSSHKSKEDLGRNQSAIELRRKVEGMSGISSHSSIMAPMRPSSLIKSKSTVAVPILVSNHSQDPILPSGGSSSHQSKVLPTPVTNLKNLHTSPIRRKPPTDVEYSSDEDDEDADQEEDGGEDAEVINREVAALPLSPRTTRRNMLANEMTESVRRNLLWERQLRNNLLGNGPIVGTSSNHPSNPSIKKNDPNPKHLDRSQSNGVVTGGTGAGTGVEKEVTKHYTKGLHRSVW
ncbi:hypothetical protein DFH28DRAFT_994060 [Melampsora americana]|nr:hypothetical protein DFH28DRAFT_994060 [Melampsora americana]